jgi:hypothetical protein
MEGTALSVPWGRSCKPRFPAVLGSNNTLPSYVRAHGLIAVLAAGVC